MISRFRPPMDIIGLTTDRKAWRSCKCCRPSTQRAISGKAALRHPPISSPARAHRTGTSAAVVNVQSGSGSRCHKPISTSDNTAPTSSPRHKPRSARATRHRKAA